MTYDVYYNNKINMECGFNTDQCLYDLGFHHIEASFSPEGPKSFFFYFSFPYISIQGPCMDCTFEPSQKPLHEVCHVETGDHLMQISPYKRKQDYQSKLLSCRHSSQNMNNKRAKKILINLKDNLPKKFTNNSYLAQ
mgnify:CR=1 FL=1